MFLYKFINLLCRCCLMKQRLVSIPKTDLESMESTIETLENREVMDQLEKSEVDIKQGRVANIDKLIKELEKINND